MRRERTDDPFGPIIRGGGHRELQGPIQNHQRRVNFEASEDDDDDDDEGVVGLQNGSPRGGGLQNGSSRGGGSW